MTAQTQTPEQMSDAFMMEAIRKSGHMGDFTREVGPYDIDVPTHAAAELIRATVELMNTRPLTAPSEDAVERAARMLHEIQIPTNAKRANIAWDKQIPEYRELMRERVRQVFAAAGVAGEWRPIESAPKDGTPIAFRSPHTTLGACRWWSAEELAGDEGGTPDEFSPGWYEIDDPDSEVAPTEWMPLPSPPAVKG